MQINNDIIEFRVLAGEGDVPHVSRVINLTALPFFYLEHKEDYTELRAPGEYYGSISLEDFEILENYITKSPNFIFSYYTDSDYDRFKVVNIKNIASAKIAYGASIVVEVSEYAKLEITYDSDQEAREALAVLLEAVHSLKKMGS
jgi:hypothetical protein